MYIRLSSGLNAKVIPFNPVCYSSDIWNVPFSCYVMGKQIVGLDLQTAGLVLQGVTSAKLLVRVKAKLNVIQL